MSTRYNVTIHSQKAGVAPELFIIDDVPFECRHGETLKIYTGKVYRHLLIKSVEWELYTETEGQRERTSYSACFIHALLLDRDPP